MRYRKLPVEIDAVQWAGDNVDDVIALVGRYDFARLAELDGPMEDTAQLLMRDHLHSAWVAIRTGDWIIRGVQGETYSCRPDVFTDTYEPVDRPIRYVVPAAITMAGPGPRSPAAPLDEATIVDHRGRGDASSGAGVGDGIAWFEACDVDGPGGHGGHSWLGRWCDAMDCECSAPHGLILPSDPEPDTSTPTER